MFEEMLPNLTGKVVVDVGSRAGAVLYGVRILHIRIFVYAVNAHPCIILY